MFRKPSDQANSCWGRRPASSSSTSCRVRRAARAQGIVPRLALGALAAGLSARARHASWLPAAVLGASSAAVAAKLGHDARARLARHAPDPAVALLEDAFALGRPPSAPQADQACVSTARIRGTGRGRGSRRPRRRARPSRWTAGSRSSSHGRRHRGRGSAVSAVPSPRRRAASTVDMLKTPQSPSWSKAIAVATFSPRAARRGCGTRAGRRR